MFMCSTPLPSLLAEKRIILFNIKKQMIGRRAYSDSIYTRTVNQLEESSTPSSTSSTPRYIPTKNDECLLKFYSKVHSLQNH